MLEAAAALVQAGRTPSVAEAAELAAVSRATAYRYFPTQESLLVEVVTTNQPALDALLGPLDDSDDPEARVKAVVDTLTEFMVEHDRGLRTMLSSRSSEASRAATRRSAKGAGRATWKTPWCRCEAR